MAKPLLPVELEQLGDPWRIIGRLMATVEDRDAKIALLEDRVRTLVDDNEKMADRLAQKEGTP